MDRDEMINKLISMLERELEEKGEKIAELERKISELDASNVRGGGVTPSIIGFDKPVSRGSPEEERVKEVIAKSLSVKVSPDKVTLGHILAFLYKHNLFDEVFMRQRSSILIEE